MDNPTMPERDQSLADQARIWLKPKAQTEDEKTAALATAYRETFTAPAGIVVLDDLAKKAGMLSLYMPAPGLNEALAIWEGRRQMFVEIANQLGWTPMEFVALAARNTAATLRAQEEQAATAEEAEE